MVSSVELFINPSVACAGTMCHSWPLNPDARAWNEEKQPGGMVRYANDTTVLALKSVYDLNGKKGALKFISDDISMLAYKKARGNYHHLAGQYSSFCVYDLRYWYTKLARAR